MYFSRVIPVALKLGESAHIFRLRDNQGDEFNFSSESYFFASSFVTLYFCHLCILLYTLLPSALVATALRGS